MSKKLSAIIGLLLTVVMFASFSIGNFEAEAAVSASYDTYLADFLLNDATAQSYINREYSIPYRKYVEDRRNSLTYTAMLEAWEILTFDAKLADKSGKCVAYYETILYDTIYGGLDGNSELNDLTSKVSSVKASTMKTLMEYSEDLVDYELEDIKKGTDLYNTLIKEFVACEALKDAFENISDLKDQLDKCKDLYEAVEKVAKVEALVENQEQIKKIVTDIGNSTANPALKLACARMTVIMDDVIPDQIIAGVFASESTIGEAVDDGFKAVWDAVLVDVAGAKLTIAVKTGQKSGKLAAGMLFSTDKDVEHVYAMDALYDIEDITVNLVKRYQSQYKSNPTQANAKLYTEAFKQLIKTYIEGVDYSKTYAEITNEQGLINQIFKKFESDDYKRFINMLDNMRLTYEDYLNYIDVCVYNNYLADVPNETVKKKVKIVKKATETTDADIMSYFDTYKTVDALYTNRVVKEEWVLTEDYTTHGSLTVEADIDLNGHTLTVGGDLTHLEGDILIHNGSLIISGDYLATKISTDSNGKIIYGNTSNNPVLRMVWENDYVFVGGDFRVNPYPLNNCALSEGVLEIQGGFYFYASNHSYGSNRYHFTENNTVVFSGNKNQTIYVENSNCTFNKVEFKNNDSMTINITGFFKSNNGIIVNYGNVTIKSDNTNANVTDIFMRAGAKVTLTGNMNGFNSINKASFSSNMADYVSVSASTITAESVGDAEVTVTNNDGDSIINLTVEKPFELGDVNRDGEITVADAVILQKWILAVPNTRLSDWKLCDLCEDEEINVFDLCLLKRKLINS